MDTLTLEDWLDDFEIRVNERIWILARREFVRSNERRTDLVKALCNAGRQLDQVAGCHA